MQSTVKCSNCGSHVIPKLWHDLPESELISNKATQHICPICGVQMYKTGGGTTIIGKIIIAMIAMAILAIAMVILANINAPTWVVTLAMGVFVAFVGFSFFRILLSPVIALIKGFIAGYRG